MQVISFLDTLYSKEKISSQELRLTKYLYLKYLTGFSLRRSFSRSEEYKIFLDLNYISRILKNEPIFLKYEDVNSQTLKQYLKEKKMVGISIGKMQKSSLEFFYSDYQYYYNSVQTILICLESKKKTVLNNIWKIIVNIGSFVAGAVVTLIAATIK